MAQTRPLQWNPVKTSFSDASQLMSGASRSVGQATDTVSNILNQQRADEELQRKKQQQEFTQQQVLDEEQLKNDTANVTTELFKAMSDTGTKDLGTLSSNADLMQGLASKYGSEAVMLGTEAVYDISKKGDDAVTSSLKKAELEDKARVSKELSGATLDWTADTNTFNKNISSLSPTAQRQALKEYNTVQTTQKQLEKATIDLYNAKDTQANRVSKEFRSNVTQAYNTATTPKEKSSVLYNALLLSTDDTYNKNTLIPLIQSNLKEQGISAAEAEALSNAGKAKEGSLKDSITKYNSGGINYLNKTLNNYSIHSDDLTKMDNTLRLINSNSGDAGISPEQLLSVYTGVGKFNTVMFGSTLEGKEAEMEIIDWEDTVLTDSNGNAYIDTKLPEGKAMVSMLTSNANELGVDVSAIPILQNTYNQSKVPEDDRPPLVGDEFYGKKSVPLVIPKGSTTTPIKESANYIYMSDGTVVEKDYPSQWLLQK